MHTSHVASFAVVMFKCRRAVCVVSAARGVAALPAVTPELSAAAAVLGAAAVGMTVRGAAALGASLLSFAVCDFGPLFGAML